MNLGKLLGAGKTFFGGQTPAAYRENKSVYLPKFNDGRNPFSSKPSAPAPTEVDPTIVAPAVPAPSSMAAPVAAMAKVAAAAPIATVAPAKSVFSAAPVTASPAKLPVAKQFRTPWAEKLNQIWAAAKLAPQPAPAGPMPTVQPELLSLDSVKVLHNDLTDVDVEVVPMKSRTVQAKAAPASMSMDFLNEPTFKSA